MVPSISGVPELWLLFTSECLQFTDSQEVLAVCFTWQCLASDRVAVSAVLRSAREVTALVFLTLKEALC